MRLLPWWPSLPPPLHPSPLAFALMPLVVARRTELHSTVVSTPSVFVINFVWLAPALGQLLVPSQLRGAPRVVTS